MATKVKKAYVKPAIDEEAIFVPESSACEWMPNSVYESVHSGEVCGRDTGGWSCAPVRKQWWNSSP